MASMVRLYTPQGIVPLYLWGVKTVPAAHIPLRGLARLWSSAGMRSVT
jgi:hypothetical protein